MVFVQGVFVWVPGETLKESLSLQGRLMTYIIQLPKRNGTCKNVKRVDVFAIALDCHVLHLLLVSWRKVGNATEIHIFRNLR